jgi:hypothetical protein
MKIFFRGIKKAEEKEKWVLILLFIRGWKFDVGPSFLILGESG